MKKLLFILGVVLSVNKVSGQSINWVDHSYQADINVQIVKHAYEADIIVYRTRLQSEAKYPGHWYWSYDEGRGRDYSSNRLNVHRVEYRYQADYRVYFTTYKSQIKLTDKYLNETK